MVRDPICRPPTPILYEDDDESEVSKSSNKSNADKKALKRAAKEADKLAAKEAKEAEKY